LIRIVVMLAEKRKKTNIGVGIGALLQIAGFFLAEISDTGAMLGLVLIVLSIPVFIWGCMNYVEGKGHSKWIGLVGLAGVIGLIVLIGLGYKDSDGSVHRLQLRKLAGLICILLGFGLVVLGRRLDDLEYAGHKVLLDHPWPGVFMLVGVCLAVGSLVLVLGNGRRG
jgi:hypothetical protein